MSSKQQASSVVLITLAEFAWLAAIVLLLLYLSQKKQVRTLELANTDWRNKFNQLQEIPEKERLLREKVRILERNFPGKSAEEIERLLISMDELRSSLARTQALLEKERLARRDLTESLARSEQQRQAAEDTLESNKKRQGEIEARLAAAEQSQARDKESVRQADVALRQRDAAEFSIRRELTGLPKGDIRRVVFIVDTSSSMVNSPSWQQSRRIIRAWIEFFPVEECALVNFNDRAKGFPGREYHRLRRSDGHEIKGQREAFLAAFDEAKPGTHTDLAAGLRLAYSYPAPNLIVLFTDGVPKAPHATSARLMQGCLDEIARHPGIPILPLALGDYEITPPEGLFAQPHTNAAISFLKEMARSSGGAFIAR